MLERGTFLLAVIGYAGLTATAVIAAHGRLPVRFWRAMALVILLHVWLVWTVRYEWRLAEAIRNGYVGFLAFHGALAMIMASVMVAERNARVLVWAAFAVVSLGAIGAVFRYDVVTVYRTPVILIALVGTVALIRAYWLEHRRPTAA
jgi:hypothetical protein